ncbi:class I SAM-dependent methyltransferase [Acidisphaera sp. L21]|uniref:class I SAM-dependent methyltransferase n=1 Tax=Acidisphaera sp. L21 TaxID=1641851 RepID=UPI0020B167B4|nr:class I SAM-dependent methyltransferase [Acidisphaera sp. L21]
MRDNEAEAIELVASLVPRHGVIAEIGSLLGRSSWIWAKSADPSVTVHCFDPWEQSGAGGNFGKLAHEHGQRFNNAQFLANTADCENIRAHQGYSPNDFLDWTVPVDLFFEDAVHADPVLSRNLEFWSSHLKPDGIACGHDYISRFPDVCRGANQLARRLGRSLRLIGSFWLLLPDVVERSEDWRVRAALGQLTALQGAPTSASHPNESSAPAAPGPGQIGDKVAAKRIIAGVPSFAYDIIFYPPGLPATLVHGEPLTIRGQLRNSSRAVWRVTLGAEMVLEFGCELWDSGGHKIAVDRAIVDGNEIVPGQILRFDLQLSTARAGLGPARFMIDLLYRHIAWFGAVGGKPVEATINIVSAQYVHAIDPAIPVADPTFFKQHIPENSPTTTLRLGVTEQQSYVVTAGGADIPVRSMLTSYELAMLYASARYHVNGQGKIVDLGPSTGVGTHIFAQGVRDNPAVASKAQTIYSYDLFLLENMRHFLEEADDNKTESTFWRFQQINQDYTNEIVPVPGDFLKMSWTGEPIEVLFVDLAKTWDLNTHVVTNFFPFLIPGHSLLIQQDYVHVGEPWIALTMEYLDEYFEFLYFIYGASAVYRLKAAIPKRVLETDLRTLPLAEVDRLFERARAKAPAAVAEVLKTCQATIHVERDELEGARRLLQSVRLDIPRLPHPADDFVTAIRPNLAAATRWFERKDKLAPKI